MVYLIIILIIALICPALAQDNSSIPFDPGAISFAGDPIQDGNYSDQAVYPIVFPSVMPKAANNIASGLEDALWRVGILEFLGNDSLNLTNPSLFTA